MSDQRENYGAFSRREAGARVPNMDHGPLMTAYEHWLGEGLNPALDPRRYDEWCDAFGLDRYYTNVGIGCTDKPPLFREEILEETDTTVTKRLADGSVVQDNKGWHKTIPHEIRPAVVTRDEWERLKAWIDVDGPLQAPDEPGAAAVLALARTAESPVRLCVGSLLGIPRNWLGFEAFAMLPYDDPDWFADILETQCLDAARQIRYFGERGIPLDCLHFWEDICFKNGPIISPVFFREYAMPRYRRLVDLANSYGYAQMSVDSDGDIMPLLPMWLESGINFLWPLEVQAGVDVNVLEEQYHGRAIWMGGIHKYKLAGTERDIAAELERVRPAAERGGYIPALDHNCPHDVSFGNFLTYLRLRHEILGLGIDAPDRARVCR